MTQGGSSSGGGTAAKQVSNNLAPSSNQPVKKLTQQELKERREKRLCFSCEEKYTPGHKCKNQRIFKLEIAPEDGDEVDWGFKEEADTAELRTIKLTLNAIAGVSAIQLLGKINGKEVGFLIDTGATHNFVDPLMIERLQLQGLDVESFEVTVAGVRRWQEYTAARG